MPRPPLGLHGLFTFLHLQYRTIYINADAIMYLSLTISYDKICTLLFIGLVLSERLNVVLFYIRKMRTILSLFINIYVTSII